MDPLMMLERLGKALDERAKKVQECEAWYDGDHPIPDPPANTAATTDVEARKAFRAMSSLAITNLLPPVVDVPSSKLRLEGFRFSLSPTSTDAEAWTIWTRNHLDGDSVLANEAALKTGQALALVWADDDGKATVTVEDPSQAIVCYEPGSRRVRKAGLKRWVDDEGFMCATLYTADWLYKYRATRAADSSIILPSRSSMGAWEPREVPGEEWPLKNPYRVVPLVEIRANPSVKASLFGGGKPEFAKQLNEQRKINQTVMSLLVTMENQSFRQRWATGWDYPKNEDGTPDKAALQRASAARLWTFEDEGVTVGEFSQADFRPFLDVLLAWVKVIASTSGTPPYAFLLGDMINVAADSLARIEGIQVGKVRGHARTLGEAWTEVINLALLIEGNEKAADPVITPVWAEFEERTATEQAALAKDAKDMGAPREAAFAMFPGVDQAEATRWANQARADDVFAGINLNADG